jgi:hypothetical protein
MRVCLYFIVFGGDPNAGILYKIKGRQRLMSILAHGKSSFTVRGRSADNRGRIVLAFPGDNIQTIVRNSYAISPSLSYFIYLGLTLSK